MSISRRDFTRISAIGFIAGLFYNSLNALYRPLAQALPRKWTAKLGYLANRSAVIEGEFELKDIEGEWPRELDVELYRIGSGQRENHGQELRHFFDGDPLLTRFSFSQQKIKMKTQFIQTPQRVEELKEKKFLYHEFGTKAPRGAKGDKNQPNISILPWQSDLLLLSESGVPVRVSTQDFSYQGQYHFSGSWPKNVTFTAHPKWCPQTKNYYAFGIKQGLGLDIQFYRLNTVTQKAERIASIGQKKIGFIHDMLMTKNYLILVIPPVSMSTSDVVLGKRPMASLLKARPQEPTEILIVHKNGKTKPQTLTLPGFMVFHHGNAYEENDSIHFHSFIAHDFSILDQLSNWREAQKTSEVGELYKFSVDLKYSKIHMERVAPGSFDFPAWNLNFNGAKNRYTYFLELGLPDELFAFNRLIKMDSQKKYLIKYTAEPGEALGEPLFVSRSDSPSHIEDDGWIICMGYSALRDESFIQVFDAKNLKHISRAWCGFFIPLGFHGIFIGGRRQK